MYYTTFSMNCKAFSSFFGK